MPYCMYVAVNEDNKISVFTVDPESGGLTHQGDVAVPGGPFTLAISPDRNHLYCGTRETPQPTFPIWLNIPLSKSSAFFKPLSICETLAVGMAIITP